MNRVYMVTKVGFGHGPAVTPEERNGRFGCGSLGLWRVGTDLEWAGDFVIQGGFLSHWQVWAGAAIGMQYTSRLLVSYAGILRIAVVE